VIFGEAVDHAGASLGGQIDRQHSAPKTSCTCASRAGRFRFSMSILLITIIRHRLRCRAQSIIRRVVSSMPAEALITTATVSTGIERADCLPDEIRVTRRIDQVNTCIAPVQMHDGRAQRVLRGLLQRIEVDTVVPFSTAPAAPIIFDFVSNCSTSVVLPAARGPPGHGPEPVVVYSAIALSPRLF